MTSPLAVVRALHEALAAGKRVSDIRHLFTDDVRTIEHPNLVSPAGKVLDLAQMAAASDRGASLLSRQTYEVSSGFEVGTLAIVRLRWTGIIARDVGPYREGQVLVAHIAQFVETRDGRIASIETYDCYEPTAP